MMPACTGPTGTSQTPSPFTFRKRYSPRTGLVEVSGRGCTFGRPAFVKDQRLQIGMAFDLDAVEIVQFALIPGGTWCDRGGGGERAVDRLAEQTILAVARRRGGSARSGCRRPRCCRKWRRGGSARPSAAQGLRAIVPVILDGATALIAAPPSLCEGLTRTRTGYAVQEAAGKRHRRTLLQFPSPSVSSCCGDSFGSPPSMRWKW